MGSTTGDFADIIVRCQRCKKLRSLAEATQKWPDDPDDMPLGGCHGCELWLGPDRWRGAPGGCPRGDAEAKEARDPVGKRLLVRSATNAYFPELMTVISIPEQRSPIDEAVAAVWDVLGADAHTLDALRGARKFNPAVKKALGDLDEVVVLAAVERRRAAPPATQARSLNAQQLEKLLGNDLGSDEPGSDFCATAVPLALLPRRGLPRLPARRRAELRVAERVP